MCRRRILNGEQLSSYGFHAANAPIHFPSGVHGENIFPLLGKVMDVLPDHNCCFRALAVILCGRDHEWRAVKSEMIREMEIYFSDVQGKLVYAHHKFFQDFDAYKEFITPDQVWGSIVELICFAQHWGYSLLVVNTNFTIKHTHAVFDRTKDLACVRHLNGDHFQVVHLVPSPLQGPSDSTS